MLNIIRLKKKNKNKQQNSLPFNPEEFVVLLFCLLSTEATPIALFLQGIAVACLDVLRLKEKLCFTGRM